MTKRTAHILFKVILDKNAQGVAFGGAPAFLSEEIDIFLDLALDQIINSRLSGNNVLQQGFEESFRRISELDTLVKTDTVIANPSKANEFVIPNLHDNGNRMFIFLFVLQFGTAMSNCTLVDHTKAGLFRQTYSNTPWVELPVVTIEDDKAYLYIDPILMTKPEYAPTNVGYTVYVSYIKKPTRFSELDLDDNIELPDNILGEIINRAAVLALENIESLRTPGKLELNQLSE